MISVILPTYGRAAMAVECLESLLANSYEDFEVLVVDQGPDATLAAAVKSRYGGLPRVRYMWVSPPGLNRARNRGLQHAKGDIVAFIDDDAIADENWLAGIAATFTELHPTPTLMGGRIVPVWPSSTRPRWLPPGREVLLGLYDIGLDGRNLPEGDLPIGANMAALRRELVAAGGFHDELEADAHRPGVQLTGGDSLVGQVLKDAGHTLYYQPRATVYHRISATKLRPGLFVKRHFWEGITEVTRMRLAGAITPKNAGAVARVHLRLIARTIRGSIMPGAWRRPNVPLSACAMTMLLQVAQSFGIVYAIVKPGRASRAVEAR